MRVDTGWIFLAGRFGKFIRGLGNFNINISAAVFVMGQERAGEMTHA